jgi:hypothetical protein
MPLRLAEPLCCKLLRLASLDPTARARSVCIGGNNVGLGFQSSYSVGWLRRSGELLGLSDSVDGADDLNPREGLRRRSNRDATSEAALIRRRSDPPKPVASPFAKTKGEAYDNREEFWRRKG